MSDLLCTHKQAELETQGGSMDSTSAMPCMPQAAQLHEKAATIPEQILCSQSAGIGSEQTVGP